MTLPISTTAIAAKQLREQQDTEPDQVSKVAALEILAGSASAEERLYSVIDLELVSDFVLRLFAVDCARTALVKHSTNPDARSLNACDVAEKFALGRATAAELNSARCAARECASVLAASGHASSVPQDYDAAQSATDAANIIAGTAAKAASYDAANAAGNAAKYAAKTSAILCERNRQIDVLIGLISEHMTA